MGWKDMESRLDELIEQHDDTVHQFVQEGRFLPIGAWSVQGFDTAAIVNTNRPNGIREHPILGTTYRVRLITTRFTKSWTTRRSEILVGCRRQRGTQSGLYYLGRVGILEK